MLFLVVVGECECSVVPVDGRVELVQPCHTEDDIVTSERKGDQVETIRIRADTNRNGRNGAGCGLLTAVSEHNGVGVRKRNGGETVTGDEGG
jgi:hypothetical protein